MAFSVTGGPTPDHQVPGGTVVITGTGFTTPVIAVEFEMNLGIAPSPLGSVFVITDDNTLTVTVPTPSGLDSQGIPNKLTAANIRVRTGVATQFTPLVFFPDQSGPSVTISSFSPPSGKTNTPVTILGSSLDLVTAISFNGVLTSLFTINNPGSITAFPPPGAGFGLITVYGSNGSSAMSASNFTLIPVGAGPVNQIPVDFPITVAGGPVYGSLLDFPIIQDSGPVYQLPLDFPIIQDSGPITNLLLSFPETRDGGPIFNFTLNIPPSTVRGETVAGSTVNGETVAVATVDGETVT